MHSLHEAIYILQGKLPIEDIGVKRRLDRAYDILRFPGYEITLMHDGSHLIDKLSSSLTEDTGAKYIVNSEEGSCTCPDFNTARAGLCKHRLAVWLMEIMDEGWM